MNFQLFNTVPPIYCKDCSKIIYNNMRNLFLNDLEYNRLYTSLCSYNLKSSYNKVDKLIKLLKTLYNKYYYNFFLEDEPICDYCYNNVSTHTIKLMLKGAYDTIITELFIDTNIIDHVIDFIDNTPGFKKNLLNRIKWFNVPYNTPLCYAWKNSEYYHKKLFGYSIYLQYLEIPREVTNIRNYSYFNDMIAGHPKASNGWYKESLDELIELGYINNE